LSAIDRRHAYWMVEDSAELELGVGQRISVRMDAFTREQ